VLPAIAIAVSTELPDTDTGPLMVLFDTKTPSSLPVRDTGPEILVAAMAVHPVPVPPPMST
jgi:hypothetical protein